jgi:hypothetical protein
LLASSDWHPSTPLLRRSLKGKDLDDPVFLRFFPRR